MKDTDLIELHTHADPKKRLLFTLERIFSNSNINISNYIIKAFEEAFVTPEPAYFHSNEISATCILHYSTYLNSIPKNSDKNIFLRFMYDILIGPLQGAEFDLKYQFFLSFVNVTQEIFREDDNRFYFEDSIKIHEYFTKIHIESYEILSATIALLEKKYLFIPLKTEYKKVFQKCVRLDLISEENLKHAVKKANKLLFSLNKSFKNSYQHSFWQNIYSYLKYYDLPVYLKGNLLNSILLLATTHALETNTCSSENRYLLERLLFILRNVNLSLLDYSSSFIPFVIDIIEKKMYAYGNVRAALTYIFSSSYFKENFEKEILPAFEILFSNCGLKERYYPNFIASWTVSSHKKCFLELQDKYQDTTAAILYSLTQKYTNQNRSSVKFCLVRAILEIAIKKFSYQGKITKEEEKEVKFHLENSDHFVKVVIRWTKEILAQHFFELAQFENVFKDFFTNKNQLHEVLKEVTEGSLIKEISQLYEAYGEIDEIAYHPRRQRQATHRNLTLKSLLELHQDNPLYALKVFFDSNYGDDKPSYKYALTYVILNKIINSEDIKFKLLQNLFLSKDELLPPTLVKLFKKAINETLYGEAILEPDQSANHILKIK